MDLSAEPPQPIEGDRYGANYEEYVDPVDGTRWRIDVQFVDSNWTCLWGQGCEGIREHPAADLEEGCCSVGAHLIDDDEAKLITALGLTLDPNRFQNCLLYTSPSPRDATLSRMPSSA